MQDESLRGGEDAADVDGTVSRPDGKLSLDTAQQKQKLQRFMAEKVLNDSNL